MQVRTNGSSGDFLFDWDSENQIVTIVKKKFLYRVKLYANNKYKIIESRPRDTNISNN